MHSLEIRIKNQRARYRELELKNEKLENEEIFMINVPETLDTFEAAEALGRKPITLRTWSSTGRGPLQPIKIHGQRGPLRWLKSDIVRLLTPVDTEGGEVVELTYQRKQVDRKIKLIDELTSQRDKVQAENKELKVQIQYILKRLKTCDEKSMAEY